MFKKLKSRIEQETSRIQDVRYFIYLDFLLNGLFFDIFHLFIYFLVFLLLVCKLLLVLLHESFIFNDAADGCKYSICLISGPISDYTCSLISLLFQANACRL